MSSKLLLRKAKAAATAIKTSTLVQSKASKPLPDESDSSDSDLNLLDAGSDDEEDSESEEEEEDVTEEALERMMELLGDDVDPDELEELENRMDQDEDESEEEEGEDMIEVEDEEALYEDLNEDDAADVVPVEKTTVNDKVLLLFALFFLFRFNADPVSPFVVSQEALQRVLATFKSDTTFFETLSLTYPKDLDIPDAENDLERELEL